MKLPDSDALPAALGERDEISIEAESGLLGLDPSLWLEFTGIGEDGLIHVDKVVRFANRCLVGRC